MAQTDNGIRIISTAADGTQGNADSGAYNGGSFYTGTDSVSISADGTKVAFMSDASNLVPGDTNGTTDIFVKDLTTGAITLASTGAVALSLPWTPSTPFARSLNPSISPDGTKVAFAATPFVNGATSGPSQIIVKDLVTGTFTLLTGDRLGSAFPVFSPDGTKVAFYSSADLTNAGTGRAGGLYLADLSTGGVRLVSTSATGAPGNGMSSEPTFSPDGTKLAFTSLSTNLGPTTRTGLITDTDVYVKDLVTGAVRLVSADAFGQRGSTLYNSPTNSANPAFSPDGTKVAFQSSAINFVAGEVEGSTDVFIKDLATGAITRVTSLADGTSGGGFGPAFSPDGTKIAFWTATTGYTPYPHASGTSIYTKDLVTGAFTLVSAPVDPAVPGVGNSQDPQFSADGSEIVFFSDNDSLVATDTNGHTADVFIKTLSARPVSPPVAVADSYTTAQGTPLTVAAAAGLLANDTDPNSKPLTAVLVGSPAHGALTLNSDGSFTYTPAAGFSGADIFTYRASEGAVQSTAATVSLTVTAAIDHPVTAVDDSYAVSNAFPSADFLVSAAAGLLANDTAPDGGLVALGIVVNGTVQTGTVRTAAGGRATVFSDGRLIYDQPFSSDDQGLVRYNGLDSFVYRVRDVDGSTADATVTLTIGSGVNHPVTAVDDSYAVSNASPSDDFSVNATAGLLANDTAPDGGLVALGIVAGGMVQAGAVRTAAGGRATVFSDGRLLYDQPFTSDAQGLIRYNGTDSFVYRVRDSDGSTADAKVTLTVGSGVNHPITAVDDSYTVSNASPSDDFLVNAASGVLANDTSPDGGLAVLGIVVNGTVQAGGVNTAAGGRATIFSDGRLLYDQPFTSDPQGLIRYNGLDSFVYRVRDSDGSTGDATVTLTVGSGINHPVSAANDSYAVSNASPSDDFLVSAANGVLANDTSLDGGLVALGIVVNGTVQTGAVRTAAGGRITVFPDGRLLYDQPFTSDAQGVVRYNGLDSFVYRVRDADGSIADATVTLTVGSGVNHPVAANDDSYAVSNASPSDDFLINAANGVLANDTSPDGGLVVLGIVVNGTVQAGTVRTLAGGSATISSDGQFLYDQPFSSSDQGVIRYNGPDSFVYRVRDADGSTADATVTLTVGGVAQTTLTKGADTVVGTSADDLISVGTQTLSVGDRIEGGGGTNHLQLVGGGIFNLSLPTVLTNVQVIDAQEGQAASAAVAATNQSIILRNGLDVTVNVRTAAVNPANPKAPTITINGADDASRINLGAGNDFVTVGGARETVAGGTGDNTIQVTAATIGATIDGGSGHSSLYVLGGGSNVTMGSNITRIATVVLAGSPGPISFIANGEAGLTVNDLNKGADTVTAGGLNQTLTGGSGAETFVGFAGGDTLFRNNAATMNGDKIANFFAPGSQVDLTDMNYATLQPLRFSAGILQVNDGTHFASMGLTGAIPAGAFITHQDSGSGTLITYQR